MDLKFDRKEMFLIGIVLLMILAWTLGNLSVAYFGMEDEDIGGEPDDPGYADEETAAFDIPVRLVRYFYYGILIAGVASIFIGPNDDILKTILNRIQRLAIIGVLFFLPTMFPYIERFGHWLNQSMISDIDFPSIDEALPGNDSQAIFSPIGSSIVILILLGTIFMIIFFVIRHKHASEESSETEEDISSSADKAITELHKGEDVRDVIIRNYQKMLIRLEEEGIEQEISFTPRELERITLDRSSLKEETIDEMTRLFEEAKYSDHPLGEKERDRAIENFKRIREELENDRDA